MRWLGLLLIVSVPAAAGPIVGTVPIPVNGSGFYDALFCCGGGWEFTFSFSGTNGIDSASVFAQGGFDMGNLGVTAPPVFTNIGPAFVNRVIGSAAIDGLTASLTSSASGPAAQFSVGQGTGKITINGPIPGPGSLLAQVDLIGYIEVTSETRRFGVPFPNAPFGLIEVRDNFNIIPTPEPDSPPLLGAALIILAFASRLKSR